MSTVNPVNKNKLESHLNWMGGDSYKVNPLLTLKMAASSCFFGEPMYYHGDKYSQSYTYDSLTNVEIEYLRSELDSIDPQEWRKYTPKQLIESAIDSAIEYSLEGTLQIAIEIRNDDHIRLTPQVILVRAANHPVSKGKDIIGNYAEKIILRTDDAINGLAYQFSAYGKPVPNSLKKVWAKFLENQDDYSLAKYKLEGHKVNLYDLVNISHPKSTDSLNKLMTGKLALGKEIETWESLISREGSNKVTWTKAVDVMGHMALLRNLRNLLKNEVNKNLFISKLIAGAKTGKQLPFRYWSAYNVISEFNCTELESALNTCMSITLENLPKLNGKVISLCDNSASATDTTISSMGTVQVSTIANLSALITAMNADEGIVGVFGDNLKMYNPKDDSKNLFQKLKHINNIGDRIGGSTENGIWIFFRDALKNKEWYDHIFIYSDMQAGHGGLYGMNPEEYRDYLWRIGNSSYSYPSCYIDVAKLITKYRKEVNKDVKVFLIQVAGYKDTIVPEFYKDTYILGGWSENLLKFAHRMSNLWKGQ